MNRSGLRLGKTPARPGAVKFRLSKYLDKTVLPKPPKEFGHETLVSNYGTLGNDQWGDCVLAGGDHETMLWNAVAKHPVKFTDKNALADYSAITGFNPNDPNSDQGTDMQVAASYRRKTGLIDASGKRHKVAAYLAITAGDVTELKTAMYLFGAVGVGIEFPASAMDQFNAGKPWSVVSRSPIEGGHYIPGCAYRGGQIVVVTWGKLQRMTEGFYKKYCDESVAYVSEEMLTSGKSPEGFDLAALLADLKALGN